MMKHPDTVKADACREESGKTAVVAADFKRKAGTLVGIAPALSEAYANAGSALEALSVALENRAVEFDESARLDSR